MSELRVQPRVNVNLTVHYQPVQELQAATSMNISSGGIYICTPQPLPRDHEILLHFTPPGVARPMQISGIVVWSNPGTPRSPFPPGMGIKFLSLTDADAELIADYVARTRAQESLAAPQPATPASPAPAPAALPQESLELTLIPESPPVEPVASSPPVAPETEIPQHVRRQLEYMMSLQAASTPPAAGPAAPTEKPAAPPSKEQPGQSSPKTRPPQKPGEKKKL
jgi:uncharacterized protein (TIGR02266 family)